MEATKFPPGVPTGLYRIDITVYNSAINKNVLKFEVYAELIRKPAADIKWN